MPRTLQITEKPHVAGCGLGAVAPLLRQAGGLGLPTEPHIDAELSADTSLLQLRALSLQFLYCMYINNTSLPLECDSCSKHRQ